jgi:histidyl-tRNA synthetase
VFCGGGGAKRQFKIADREGARFVVIIGEDEMQSGCLTLKNMQNGEQRRLDVSAIVSELLSAKLGRGSD